MSNSNNVETTPGWFLLISSIFLIFICWGIGKGFERFVEAIYGNDDQTVVNTVIINSPTYRDTVYDTVTVTKEIVVIDTLYKIQRIKN